MANVNAPFGLQQLDSSTGAAPNFQMSTAVIAYNDTTKIYTGDPVKMLNTGFIAQWTAGTEVSQLWGIFAGCSYLSTSQGVRVYSQFWPGADVASTAQNSIVANIIPCTGAIAPTFVIQSDATGLAFADIGANAEITLGTGSTITGRSGAYMSGISTTITLPLRIIALYGNVSGSALGGLGGGGFGGYQPSSTNPYGGSPTGAYAWAVVRANVTGYGATGL